MAANFDLNIKLDEPDDDEPATNAIVDWDRFVIKKPSVPLPYIVAAAAMAEMTRWGKLSFQGGISKGKQASAMNPDNTSQMSPIGGGVQLSMETKGIRMIPTPGLSKQAQQEMSPGPPPITIIEEIIMDISTSEASSRRPFVKAWELLVGGAHGVASVARKV